jgi:hypothetical protein
MLLCKEIDVDLASEQDVYEDATETIAYLENIKKLIEKRVLNGEKIKGFTLGKASRRRAITEKGLAFIEKTFGRDKAYKVIEKPIGITDLADMLNKDQVEDMLSKGYIGYTEGNPKVVFRRER